MQLVQSLILILSNLCPQILSLTLSLDDVQLKTSQNDKKNQKQYARWEVLGDLHPLTSAQRPLASMGDPCRFNSIKITFFDRVIQSPSHNIFEFTSTQRAIPSGRAESNPVFPSRIGLQDLWISCLKLGINLSHRSVPLIGFIEAEFFKNNFDLMHGLLTWRRTHAAGNESPSEVGFKFFLILLSSSLLEICL
jgi:hypothetical protein